LKKFHQEITGFTVNWDDNLATAIDTLADTGKWPTLWDDRVKESFFMGRDRKSFDAKASHFDIILISPLDLLGSPGFILIHVDGTAIGKVEGLSSPSPSSSPLPSHSNRPNR
jgi:hypothetical protein